AGRLCTNDTVTVIGFGGLLDAVCRWGRAHHIYVCDFIFREEKYRNSGERRLNKLTRGRKNWTLIDDVIGTDILSRSDIALLTGSAICNGTLDELLDRCRSCREVILQGPSCSLVPSEFFRRGVTMVVTT